MMNSGFYVLQGIHNGCLVNTPWRIVEMNANGQTRIPELIIRPTVEMATVTPSTPLDARGYERLERPSKPNDDQWKPVLAQYCDNPDFESIRDLCDGEILLTQADREYYENLKQQLEQESKTKKIAIDKLRRRKIRDAYKSLSKTCRLPDGLYDEEISKKVCKLIASNKIEMSIDRNISVVKSVDNSESGVNDSDTNASENNVSESTAVKGSDNVSSEDKKRPVEVTVNKENQHGRVRRKIREKERRDYVNEYHQIILDNIPWLSEYTKEVKKLGVLCNAELYFRIVESIVGVEPFLHQSEGPKERQVKATDSTSQDDKQEKQSQSHAIRMDGSIESIASRSVASTSHASVVGGEESDQTLCRDLDITNQSACKMADMPALQCGGEDYPILDFNSTLDCEVATLLANAPVHGNETEQEGFDPHDLLETPDFQCDMPVKADSPKLTDMSATVLHHINKSAKELPLEEPAQVACFYDKTKAKYSCRLCSQTFIFKKALLKHHAADHQPESVNRLKCSGKRRAEIPATEMKDGKRIEIDDFNNNVVKINANDTSLFDSGGISGKVSNKPLVEPLSYGDPEDDHSHGAKTNSISPVIQVDEKRHQDDEGYTPDIELTDSAFPSTSYCLEMGDFNLACPQDYCMGEKMASQISRSSSQDSGIYSLDEGSGSSAAHSDRRRDQVRSSVHSPCPALTSYRFEKSGLVDMGNGTYLSSHEAIIQGVSSTPLSHSGTYGNTSISLQDEYEKIFTMIRRGL